MAGQVTLYATHHIGRHYWQASIAYNDPATNHHEYHPQDTLWASRANALGNALSVALLLFYEAVLANGVRVVVEEVED